MERDGKMMYIKQASNFISLENMTINKKKCCQSDVYHKRGVITKRNLTVARGDAGC